MELLSEMKQWNESNAAMEMKACCLGLAHSISWARLRSTLAVAPLSSSFIQINERKKESWLPAKTK